MPSTCACQNLLSSVSVARTCSRRGRPKQSSGSRRARATSAPATSSSSTDGSPKRRTAQWSARLKAARCTSERPRGPGRVGDLPLHARLVLVVALEVVAVGDAVDAVDARGVEGLQPLGDLLELRAPGGGEARALDRGLRVREVRRPRLVARRALVGRPLLPLRRILELGRRLVEVRVAGVETSRRSSNISPTESFAYSSDCLRRSRIGGSGWFGSKLGGAAVVRGRRRSRRRLARLPARVLLLRRDALRVLLRDDPVRALLHLRHPRVTARLAERVPHRATLSDWSGARPAATARAGRVNCGWVRSLRHSQSCAAPPSSSLAGWPQVGHRGGSALTA